MELILRTLAIYGALMFLFRVAGKRTLADATPFEMVLLLVISEAVQQALVGDDFSLTAALVVITTFVMADVLMSMVQYRLKSLDKVVSGLPVVVVAHGQLLDDAVSKTRVDGAEVLQAARESHGLERMDQIRYAVVEKSGTISVVPIASA